MMIRILVTVSFLWIAVTGYSSPDETGLQRCLTNSDCRRLAGNEYPICCICGQTPLCCNETAYNSNGTKCVTRNNPEVHGSPIKMLGAVIGAIVLSFIVAIFAHSSMKRCVKKFRRYSEEPTESGVELPAITRQNSLPLYHEAIQFPLKEAGYNYAYECNEGNTGEDIITDSSSKCEANKTDKFSTDEEQPPPSYNSLVFKSTDENSLDLTISVIYEPLSTNSKSADSQAEK